jgi:hypothetical protein
MHAGRIAIDDIDDRISEKVWKYRFPNEEVPLNDKEKLSRLVHTRFRSNRPDLAATSIHIQAQQPTIDPVVVDLWIYKDIFAAWDEKTQEKTNVTVKGIYILPKCAPCDPLVILKSIAENNPMASTLVLGCIPSVDSSPFVSVRTIKGRSSTRGNKRPYSVGQSEQVFKRIDRDMFELLPKSLNSDP